KSRGVSPRMKEGWEKAAGDSPRRLASSPAPSPRAPWQPTQLSANNARPRSAEGGAGGSGSSWMPVRSVMVAAMGAGCSPSPAGGAPAGGDPAGGLRGGGGRGGGALGLGGAPRGGEHLPSLFLFRRRGAPAGAKGLVIPPADARQQREEPPRIGGGVA